MAFPESGPAACHTEAPEDEDAWGTHTDHRCSDTGLEPSGGLSASGTILFPRQGLAMPMLHQLRRPPRAFAHQCLLCGLGMGGWAG